MNINLRIIEVVTGVLCLALAVTGCTSTVTGTASPAANASPTTPADVFASLNACQLLDQLTAGQGFNPGENKSRRNQCVAVKSGFGSYALALDSDQGLTEFAATDPGAANMSINGRNAMQANTSTGGCAVAIEVTQRARALIIATMAGYPGNPQTCVNARAFAEKVEPLLPKVQ